MSSAPYRDGEGLSWQADPAAVAKPTYAYLHNRLINATSFLKNTRSSILPGNCTRGFAAAVAEGGACFWLYQPFEPGSSHRIVDPREYEGILSPLFCASGFIGRIVSVRFWALFQGDIYSYMPGMADDHLIGAPGVAHLYLSPDGQAEQVGRDCSFEDGRFVFTFSVGKADGGGLWAGFADNATDPDDRQAAAVKFLVECGPVFVPPSL